MQRIFRSNTIKNFRMFSDAAKHTPPSKVHGITGRYAGALYTAASKAGQLEKVEGELLAFSNTLKNSKDFAKFLANPTVARSEKVSKINDVLEDSKISYFTKNLFLTMSANGKIKDADKVVAAFVEMMEVSRGVVNVKIVSAEKLTDASLKTVQGAVSKLVGAGKKVNLEVKQDPKLLGGLQIHVGDKFLDLSVSR